MTGALACGTALINAGLRYWYAIGREGILPRPSAARTRSTSRRTSRCSRCRGRHRSILLVFWFFDRGPLEIYGWMAVQGVIWILLVQALAALSTFFFFRKHYPDEMHPIKTIAAPWIGFVAQIVVLLLLYHNLYFLAAGAWYVNPVFELFSGWAAAPVQLDRHHRRARAGRQRWPTRTSSRRDEPGQVRGHGPLRQRGRVAEPVGFSG